MSRFVCPSAARSATRRSLAVKEAHLEGRLWAGACGVDLGPDPIHKRLRAANVRRFQRAPQRLARLGWLARSAQRGPEPGKHLRLLEPRRHLLEQRARHLELVDPVGAQDGAEHSQRAPDGSWGSPAARDLEFLARQHTASSCRPTRSSACALSDRHGT